MQGGRLKLAVQMYKGWHSFLSSFTFSNMGLRLPNYEGECNVD